MSDQIDVNQLSNALQQKVDLPSGKSQSDIDYVVEWQTPTSSNNYTWYRLYKSGWIEQGGEVTQSSSTSFSTTLTFSKTMNDTHYFLSWAGGADQNDGAGAYGAIQYNTTTITTNSVGVYVGNSNANFTVMKWKVEGFAAQS